MYESKSLNLRELIKEIMKQENVKFDESVDKKMEQLSLRIAWLEWETGNSPNKPDKFVDE